jgi:hypothetical protein
MALALRLVRCAWDSEATLVFVEKKKIQMNPSNNIQSNPFLRRLKINRVLINSLSVDAGDEQTAIFFFLKSYRPIPWRDSISRPLSNNP